jgi:hypothetical protein
MHHLPKARAWLDPAGAAYTFRDIKLDHRRSGAAAVAQGQRPAAQALFQHQRPAV